MKTPATVATREAITQEAVNTPFTLIPIRNAAEVSSAVARMLMPDWEYLKKRKKPTRRITVATMVLELVAGILAGSLALVSDAGHMLTHGFSLIVSYFATHIARRPATDRRSFGLYRAEILAALFNASTLIVITGFIAWFAVKRLIRPVPIAGGWMLAVAVIGLVVNVLTTLLLRSSVHDNLNIRSAFVHMLGDMFSSVVVVAGAVVIIRTGWYPIDPILSVLVCGLILVWAYRLIRESAEILLQFTPEHIDIDRIGGRLSSLKG